MIDTVDVLEAIAVAESATRAKSSKFDLRRARKSFEGSALARLDMIRACQKPRCRYKEDPALSVVQLAECARRTLLEDAAERQARLLSRLSRPS